MSRFFLIPFLFIIFFFSSCNFAPTYRKPKMELSQNWKTTPEITASTKHFDHWWEIFEDNDLNNLEGIAIQNNPSIFVAMQRVAEARAVAKFAKSELYPQITLNPSYQNTGALTKAYIPIPQIEGSKSVFRVHEMEYAIPLNLNYELDLWGKYRNYYAAAKMNAQAQEEALHAAILSLTTDLAKNYFQYRSLDTQAQLIKEIIKANQKNYELVKERYEKGLVSKLNFNSAEKALFDLEANYEETISNRSLTENQIALLLGMEPAQFSLESSILEKDPPLVPVGLPSSILLQRPDISQVERNMAAANALIGVAYASFFPSLTLTGALGFSSPDLRHFLRWESRLWQMGARVAQTVFEGGRNRAKVLLAKSYYLETTGNYKNTILTALKEVEDALNNLERQQKQYSYLTESTYAALDNYRLSLQRYEKGLVPYLEVVDNNTTALQAKLQAVNLLGIRHISTVELIKSLGGRWKEDPEAATLTSCENTN